MVDLSNITTLIFDFGGVLIDLDRDRSVNHFKALGVENADALLNNYVQSGIFLQLEDGSITAQEFRDGIRKETGKELCDQDIDQAFLSFLISVPDEKMELLLQLKQQYRVVLLSNTNPIHFTWCQGAVFNYKGHNIHDFFDHCYLSYQMKSSKPEPEIFQKLLAEEGVSPEHCLLLDDGEQNCKTAQALGINTYLVKPHEDLRPLFIA